MRAVTSTYNAFLAANRWGHLDATSLLNAFARYIEGNDFTARWVQRIAHAFRAADAPGGIATLPDFAIRRSLVAAHLIAKQIASGESLEGAAKIRDRTAFAVSSVTATRAETKEARALRHEHLAEMLEHPHGEPNSLSYSDPRLPKPVEPVRLTPAHP